MSTQSALWPLVWNGFRESRRNRVTVVVFLFAFVLIFAATFALELTVATFDRVLTDIGLGTMAMISVFLSIFLASGLIPREIERRTIFMVVSRPVSRSLFVVGRLIGNLVTVAFVILVMGVLFFAQVLLNKGVVTSAQFVAIFGLFLEVTVLSCVGFMFASASSQFVAAVASVGLYFTGHLSGDLYKMASKAENPLMSVLGKVAYFVLPNLERLDFRARATYAEPTPLAELGSSTVYALGYSVVMVVIACWLFERRDFK